ncbi:MAG: tetratricopeptide repeat protein, partial [Candidatus Babeliales bacterium]
EMAYNKLFLFFIIIIQLCFWLSPSNISQEAKQYFAQAEAYKKEENITQAIAHYQKAIDLDHQCIEAYQAISDILKKKEQFVEASQYLEQALHYSPTNIALRFHLGCLYLNVGNIDSAIQAFDYVYHQAPQMVSALYNKGYALKTAGRIDDAIKIYQEVLKKNPHNDGAHLALGFAYLNKGDFDQGWKQHERYLKKAKKNADKLRTFLKNNELENKVIFLRPEGGIGDTLNFVRYAQRLKIMGATVIALVQKPLIPLLSLCPYIDKLLASNQQIPYDASSTFMSLPAVFNDNEETFPRTVPYLIADPTRVQYWKEKLTSPSFLKIGICWQADVKNDVSRLSIARRGIPLSQFFSLASIPNIQFYSLQQYDGIEQLVNIPDDFPLHVFDNDFDKKYGSFMDTAAVMEQIDLIITVDTAIAHLAGALGRPVWLLLPYATDWRWIVNRTTSPWYPTMRIFKQPKPFDWESVMKTVYDELERIQKK